MREWNLYVTDRLSDLNDMIFIEIHYIRRCRLVLSSTYMMEPCAAADRIPPGEQIVSRSSVSLQTGSLHRDRPPEDLLRHSGCCRFGSGDSPWTAGPERGL